MKKLIGFAAMCITAGALLVGCKSDCIEVSYGTDVKIFAMKDTGVLYYRGYRMMAPYYNENGHLCRWVDGKIVEIDSEVRNDGK